MGIIKLKKDLTNVELIDMISRIDSEYIKVRGTLTRETHILARKLLSIKAEIIDILEQRHEKEVNSTKE